MNTGISPEELIKQVGEFFDNSILALRIYGQNNDGLVKTAAMGRSDPENGYYKFYGPGNTIHDKVIAQLPEVSAPQPELQPMIAQSTPDMPKPMGPPKTSNMV